MTDRELLEAAARAAGMSVAGEWGSSFGPFSGLCIRQDDCPSGFRWNPLQDEGDSYRLLKALRMAIDFEDMSVIYTLDGSICEESFRNDGDDARAVLRAAAEIGRARK